MKQEQSLVLRATISVLPHIGIVVDQESRASGRYMVLHNIGRGPKIEDVLFSWNITGHYRYFGPRQ